MFRSLKHLSSYESQSRSQKILQLSTSYFPQQQDQLLMKYSYDSNGGGPVLGAGLLQLQVMFLNHNIIVAAVKMPSKSNDLYWHDTDPYNADGVVSLSVRPPDALPLAFEGLYIDFFVILGHKQPFHHPRYGIFLHWGHCKRCKGMLKNGKDAIV